MKRPSNKREMLQIMGVGEYKFEKYGTLFLELLSQNSGNQNNERERNSFI
jgi:superfamily II DNA helicase RecQ